jgi:hypothetical protein
VLKPRWTSATFLLYAGGLTVLYAAANSLDFLSSRYGKPGLVGWAGLVFAGLAALTFGLDRTGRRIAAGVFAFGTTIAFAVLVGSLLRWLGWIPASTPGPFAGTHPGLLALEALTAFTALVVVMRLRLPLPAAIVVGAGWYFVTDLVSNGGDFSAVISILVGAGFLVLGVVVDRLPAAPIGFWLHLGAGLTIGGGLLFFLHGGALDWVLVAVAGVVYAVAAVPLRRSSYAVLGALGLALSAAYFVNRWAGSSIEDFLRGHHRRPHPWASPLVMAFLGFVVLALGLLLDRDRRAGVAAQSGPSGDVQ